MKRFIVVCVLAVSGVAMSAPPCWACSCEYQTKKERAENADAVFFGKVLDISGGNPDDGLGDDNIRVAMRVRTVYKGKKIERLTTVRTNESEAACGIETFEEGDRYTIFADKRNGKLFTDLCSGTKRGDINHEKYGLPAGHPPDDG